MRHIREEGCFSVICMLSLGQCVTQSLSLFHLLFHLASNLLENYHNNNIFCFIVPCHDKRLLDTDSIPQSVPTPKFNGNFCISICKTFSQIFYVGDLTVVIQRFRGYKLFPPLKPFGCATGSLQPHLIKKGYNLAIYYAQDIFFKKITGQVKLICTDCVCHQSYNILSFLTVSNRNFRLYFQLTFFNLCNVLAQEQYLACFAFLSLQTDNAQMLPFFTFIFLHMLFIANFNIILSQNFNDGIPFQALHKFFLIAVFC